MTIKSMDNTEATVAMTSEGCRVFTPRSTSAENLADGQPFGSMPRFRNSARPNSFNQLLVLVFSSSASPSNCFRSSVGIRIGSIGDLPLPFGCLSLDIDMHMPIGLLLVQIGIYINMCKSIKATPRTVRAVPRRLTTTLTGVTIMAMYKSTQTHPKFIWRFLALKRSDLKSAPCHLQFKSESGYIHDSPAQSGVGFDSLNTNADIHRTKRFFFVRSKPSYARTMVGRSGGAFALAGFVCASLSTLLRPTTPFDSGSVRLQNLTNEAINMATPTPSHPKFLWRFYSSYQRTYHTVTASTETEARKMLPTGSMIFTARIRQEVIYA